MLTYTYAAYPQSRAQTRRNIIIVNVALGASTGAVGQLLNGHSALKGLLKGAMGGALVSTGKCMVAQQTPLTDWLGRGTVAVGSSVVRNAALGKTSFREIVLPVGPLTLYRDNKSGVLRGRLDLGTALTAIYMESRENTSISPSLSLLHGGLIFETEGNGGLEAQGVVRVREENDSELSHELTHVAQDEFVSIAWEEPIESALSRFIPGGKTLHRYVDLGILAPIWAIANGQVAIRDRPWEKEARFFTTGC
jgi:hypothetical protein